MPQRPHKMARFWHELKRRRVVHVITVYASASFVLIELVNNLTEPLNLPDTLATIAVVVLAVGFPLAVILAWIYDLTPEGIEKTKPVEETERAEQTKVPNAWRIATYVSFVVIVGLLTLNIMGGTNRLKAGEIQSLVVLPFYNYTGDDQLDYFVSGMHSALVGDMGKISGLRVISETSARAYKDLDMTATQIASELNVDGVIETSVLCVGDTICIQYRLVKASGEEEQLYSADIREEKSRILGLYQRITRQIADEIKIELTIDEDHLLSGAREVNKEAYDAYLKAESYWEQLGPESFDKALELYNIAIQLDPDWAPPYTGVAGVWGGRVQMAIISPEIGFPIANEYLQKALALDPDYPEMHYILALNSVWTYWDWEKGEKEFLKALSINPNHAKSRIYYAHLLSLLQRTDEALEQGRIAVDLDPRNALVLALYAVVLKGANQYEEAYTYSHMAMAIDSANGFARSVAARDAFKLGRYEEAFVHDLHRIPFEKEIADSIHRIFKRQGRQPAYEELVRQLELHSLKVYVSPGLFAWRYYQIGKYSKALDKFEEAYELHTPNIPYLGVNNLDHLHDSTRFIAIVKKMNLPQPKQ
jgi:adenylate cyclase